MKDLKIEFFKSGGPGGQHKNKRSMAVRLTHLRTGLKAVATEYRSQALNKELALKRLEKKLAALFKPKKKRLPTKVSQSVKEKVLAWKRRRSLQKQRRRKDLSFEES